MDNLTASSAGPELALIGPAKRAAEDLAAVLSGSRTLPDSFTGYEITREIHRGGQGVVYHAIQKATRRKVAIKVLREGPFAGQRDRVRFEREVHILGHLKHPNIVSIHDCGEASGHFYYVMDYIPGQPLDIHAASNGRSIEESLKLFGKVCDAVNAAHLHGVIHRDLKPGNIQIDAAGEPHLLDFGLAKIAAGEVCGDSHPQAMTLTGQFLGSLPWASPEQASGAPEQIDIRTDVYSLGVILYQMLTGRFPYSVVGNMRDVLDNILKVEPAKPSTIRRQINDEVETIVLKCLCKEPDRRYQTAGELARDIKHYLAGEPIEAKRDSSWYVIRKTLRRQKPKIIALAALAPILMALGAYGYERSKQGRAAQLVSEGRELEQKERWSEAISKYDAALAEDPACYDAIAYKAYALKEEYFRKPYSYRDIGLLEESTTLCDRAIEMRSDRPGTWNLRCQLLRSLDQPQEAEDACRQALKLDPYYYNSASNLAKVLAEQHRFDEAVQFARSAVDTASRKPEKGKYDDGVWLTLGTLQLHLGQGAALEPLSKAVDLDPKDQRNRLMLSRLHLTLPDYLDLKKALKEADRANAFTGLLDPRFKRILAQAHLRNEEYEDALTHAEAAIEGGDEPAYGHLLATISLARLGRSAEAGEHFKQSLASWPEQFEKGVIVSAEKGFLWFDSLQELESLRDEAEHLVREAVGAAP